MKKDTLIIAALIFCILLSACGSNAASVAPASCQHTYGDWTVISEPYGGNAGQRSRSCALCGETETADYPADALYKGYMFTLTPAEFNQRLDALGKMYSADFAAVLEVNDWNVCTNLTFKGETFSVVNYYNTDKDLPEPLSGDARDSASIGRIIVTDYLYLDHAPNSFYTILMAFDPAITEADIQDVRSVLEDNYSWDREMDVSFIEVNGLGYGYSALQNQMIESSSFCIFPVGQ